MDLPLVPPVTPMLARARPAVPDEPGQWSYEPKWDGFRAIVFRDCDEVMVQSRTGKDLSRYFPELLEAFRAELAPRCVLDGEIVVPREIGGRTRLDWEALSARIHPADSRVRLLAEQTPAHFIAFDAMAVGDRSILNEPFRQRRSALVDSLGVGSQCHLTRATEDPDTAERWLTLFEGAGLDGVIAKKIAGQYLPGRREMVKVKHARDAECVVLGYRPHSSGDGVGSVLLGLYDDAGRLHMVGGAASFSARQRRTLLAELEPLRLGADVVAAGEPSRWATGSDKRWVPVRPERVAEVAYDQMEGARFRHTVRFLRWRPDRDAAGCTFDQLETPIDYDVRDVLDVLDVLDVREGR